MGGGAAAILNVRSMPISRSKTTTHPQNFGESKVFQPLTNRIIYAVQKSPYKRRKGLKTQNNAISTVIYTKYAVPNLPKV